MIIGACTTHEAISSSEIVRKYAPLLAKACSDIGSPAIRNAGTLGGNVCNAAPWADGVTALLALDASVLIASATEDRLMKVVDLIKGPSQTDIRRGEILKEIHVPVMTNQHKYGWFKQGQRKGASISVVSVAVCMDVENGICRNGFISIGAAGRIPYLSIEAASIFDWQPFSEQLAEKAGIIVSEEIKPREDFRATGWYRKKVVGTIVKQVISSLKCGGCYGVDNNKS